MAYSPAAQLSTFVGLAHGLNYYLTRKALDNLVTKTMFMKACEKFTLPKNNGKTLRMYRYGLLGTNTTPGTEGTVGTGKNVSSRVLDCSVAEYDDFINWSTMHQDTDIANIAEEYSRLLSIQAALSVDTIIRAIFDDSSGSTTLTGTGVSFNRRDIAKFRAVLQSADVQPYANGNFLMFIHPNITYDLQNDPTAGGLLDVAKHTDPQMAGLKKMEDRGHFTTTSGFEVKETTNGYSSGGTTYRVYGFGDRCAGVVNLGDVGPSDVEDPKNQKFKIRVVSGGNPSITDPVGTIGGAVSYRFVFGATLLDGPAGIGGTYRFRLMDPTTSIT